MSVIHFLRDLAQGIYHLFAHLAAGVRHRIKNGEW